MGSGNAKPLAGRVVNYPEHWKGIAIHFIADDLGEDGHAWEWGCWGRWVSWLSEWYTPQNPEQAE